MNRNGKKRQFEFIDMNTTTTRFSNRDIIEKQIDDLEQRIRNNIEVMTGFVNEETQAYKLHLKFLRFDNRRSGYLTFEEFNAAMIEMNFVGVQRAVKGLFQRYDVDGVGYEILNLYIYIVNSHIKISVTIYTV